MNEKSTINGQGVKETVALQEVARWREELRDPLFEFCLSTTCVR